MKKSQGGILGVCAAALCLLTTTSSPARADGSQEGLAQGGAIARAGTSVGFAELAQHRWSTLGGHIAIGYRLGRLAIEGDYENSKLLYYTGLDNQLRGQLKRVGVNLRYYVLRIGQLSDGNSQVLVFADLATGRQRGVLEGIGFERSDLGGGFGWLFEHEVERPGIGIEQVGWHFGWRMVGTSKPSEAMARVICGKKCPTGPMPMSDETDLGLSVNSSLSLRW